MDNHRSPNTYGISQQIQRQRVSDGAIIPLLDGCKSSRYLLVVVWPQLGDFDSLEYGWWLKRESQRWQDQNIIIRAIGIGDRASGQKFCDYTQFPANWLYFDPQAEPHI
jgi:hypothetical protein